MTGPLNTGDLTIITTLVSHVAKLNILYVYNLSYVKTNIYIYTYICTAYMRTYIYIYTMRSSLQECEEAEPGGACDKAAVAILRAIHSIHYVTLHYITLRYVTLRYVMLRYVTLRCVTLLCVALRSATLRYATLRYATLRYATLPSIHYATLR